MNFKRFVIFALTLCLMLCLCACGGDSDGNTATTEASKAAGNTVTKPTAGETEPVDDGKVEYKITVVDFDGNPVEGARVQLCVGELCKTPAPTDAQGVVTFNLEEDIYEVKVSDIPENMEMPIAPQNLYTGERELTIELQRKVFNYAVTVTDEGGNPVSLVKLQFQNESLSEGRTDEDGKCVSNSLAKIESVVLTELPTGYTADAMEYTFGDDSYNAEEDVYELTIILKAVA